MNLIACFKLLVFADEPDLAKCEIATFRYPLAPSHQAARRHDRNRSGPDQLEPCTAPLFQHGTSDERHSHCWATPVSQPPGLPALVATVRTDAG